MNVFDYIKNYAEAHNINKYSLKSKYLTKYDIAQPLQLSGGVAFFYKIFAVGEIANTENLAKKFVEISTPTDYWDLSSAVEIVDFSTIQKVCTNVIITANNTIDFKLYETTADAMFTTIVNFCAQYIYLTPLPKQEINNKTDILHIKVNN